jgi:diadenylate cyclase
MGFLHFGIKDAIDILLVWFLFYEVLKLFRGTRAAYIFLGILVIIFIALLSQFLHLDAVNWILSAIWTIGLVALVIIFQPEIRRALATLGRNPMIRAFTRGETAITISKIVQAAFLLRDRGLGGLIVVERKTSLREYIEESGVSLDAEVSAPLIVSILTPPSPLHDGALIIKSGRIIGARVVLPLSDNPDLDPSLGTRHRAAVGITEISDAVAIVISEERRSVRTAAHGILSAPHTKESLGLLLKDLLYPLTGKEEEEEVKVEPSL